MKLNPFRRLLLQQQQQQQQQHGNMADGWLQEINIIAISAASTNKPGKQKRRMGASNLQKISNIIEGASRDMVINLKSFRKLKKLLARISIRVFPYPPKWKCQQLPLEKTTTAKRRSSKWSKTKQNKAEN